LLEEEGIEMALGALLNPISTGLFARNEDRRSRCRPD